MEDYSQRSLATAHGSLDGDGAGRQCVVYALEWRQLLHPSTGQCAFSANSTEAPIR